MAVDRVAQGREGADPVLALQPPGVEQRTPTGGYGKVALAHRARLPGTEAGTWTGALRRTELARVSSPRDALDCRLRVPGGGTMPFFPRAQLATPACSRHPPSPTPPAPRREAPGRCPLERNGTTRTPSRACAVRSQPTWPVLSPDVHAAYTSSYHTVVLAGCGKPRVEASTVPQNTLVSTT